MIVNPLMLAAGGTDRPLETFDSIGNEKLEIFPAIYIYILPRTSTIRLENTCWKNARISMGLIAGLEFHGSEPRAGKDHKCSLASHEDRISRE